MATPRVALLDQAALQSAKAAHSVLLAVTRAGERLVAVGERGIVLLSDDSGVSWRQAKVPVSVSLTAVQFVDAQ
ncbi:WD40/YVTN/BNR-like repeat-containing protein, partial [Pseudomonas fluorescens]